MSKPKTRSAETVDRRGFLRTGAAAVVSAAAAGPIASAAGETPANSEPIATRSFGKTEQELPILGYGGAALIKGSGQSSFDRRSCESWFAYAYDRGIRYFDTAGNYQESQSLLGEGLKGIRDKVYLVTKVETTEPDKVRGAVERSLKELQTDYLDAILIHGTPGIETNDRRTVHEDPRRAGQVAR